jgi:predicted amidohydrolase YtcJ
MDGSLGARTALFHEVYADDATTAGLRVEEYEWMLENALLADRAGLQVSATDRHRPA